MDSIEECDPVPLRRVEGSLVSLTQLEDRESHIIHGMIRLSEMLVEDPASVVNHLVPVYNGSVVVDAYPELLRLADVL